MINGFNFIKIRERGNKGGFYMGSVTVLRDKPCCETLLNDGGTSFYDSLPLNMLGGFYYHISQNIRNGTLSNAMYHELYLIEQTAVKKGILLADLYNQGAFMK